MQKMVGFLWRENLGLFATEPPCNLGRIWGTPAYNPIKASATLRRLSCHLSRFINEKTDVQSQEES